MMENSDFYYLGLITKPFGLKGHLFAYLDTDEPEKYLNLKAVFLNFNDEYIPYIIEEVQFRGGNQFVFKFADVNAEEAKQLLKVELYLPLSELPPLSGNQFYYHEVIGFTVIDKEKGNIGICQDFIDICHQPIMQVDKAGKEILIPAIDQIFDNIDRDNKTIFISAPDGLIDIYLT